ncbi:MAG: alpha/beta hydrolase [Sphingobacteriales bacterium]|nr:MAG: alpha/beta hydrolase [Sphingobacteriales bacterium]
MDRLQFALLISGIRHRKSTGRFRHLKKRLQILTASLLLTFSATAQSPTVRPLILGRVETFHSTLLDEDRRLNIYLPEGYSAGDTARYPVIYLLDGGTDEDFLAVAGLVKFSSFPWVRYLQPSILVGIENVNRKRDYTFPATAIPDPLKTSLTGQSAAFRKMLETELLPFVERHYRASGTRTLIGESLGGLLATEVLLKQTALFQNYIIVSPSLWWNEGSLLQDSFRAVAQQLQKPTQVFIAVGKEGLAPSSTPHVMEVDANILADRLRALKHPLLQVHFDYLPAEDHATISQQALLNAFRTLCNR